MKKNKSSDDGGHEDDDDDDVDDDKYNDHGYKTSHATQEKATIIYFVFL